MPPPSRDHLGRRDSAGFDQGLWFVPSCPLNLPKVSRGCRAAASGCHLQPSYAGLAHPCRRVHLPMRSAILGIVGRVAPRRRQPQATAAAPVPDFHRPSVVQSVGRLLPTTWPQGHKLTASEHTRHQSGTRKQCLAALPRLRSSAVCAPSLPDSALRSASSRPKPSNYETCRGSDGVLAPPEHSLGQRSANRLADNAAAGFPLCAEPRDPLGTPYAGSHSPRDLKLPAPPSTG